MGRISVEVDKEKLQSIIKTIEAGKEFSNRSELYDVVSKEYETQTGTKVSPSVVYLRVRDWALEVSTPMGRRGNPDLGKTKSEGKKRKEKDLEVYKQTAAILMDRYKDIPSLHGTIAKIAEGSETACRKMKCIDCCGGVRKEVAGCNSKGCADYPSKVRLFGKGKNGKA